MINYRYEVVKDEFFADRNSWCVKIYANSDFVVSYGNIDTEEDASVAGEAFIDGIKFSEGKL